MSRTITITSGKGGVGKTSISLNLALHLASLGHKVCLFDADLGLANINILLGIYPKYTISDLIFSNIELEDIILHERGIDILPGSSGVEELANLSKPQTHKLIQSLSALSRYDFLIFDTSAGISENVISFCLSTSEVFVIITDEPTSLTDAYSLLKVLGANGFSGTAKIIVNNIKNPATAKQVFSKFKAAVAKYLDVSIAPLGPVYNDQKVTEAVRRQDPFIHLWPESIASKCIKKLGERLLRETTAPLEEDHISSFWQKCLSFFKTPVKTLQKEKISIPTPPPAQPEPAEKEMETPPSPKKESPPPSAQRLSAKADAKTDYPPAIHKDQATKESLALEHSLIPIMEMLSEGIASISVELQLIRSAIEKNARRPEHEEKILLDFEAFLKKRDK